MHNETSIYLWLATSGTVILLIIAFISHALKIDAVRICGFDIIQAIGLIYIGTLFLMPIFEDYSSYNIKAPERHIALQQEGAGNEIYDINAMLKAELEKQIDSRGSFTLLDSRSSNFINIYLCSYKIGEDENSYIMEFKKNAFGKMRLEKIEPAEYDTNIAFSSNGIFGSYIFEIRNGYSKEILDNINEFDFEMEKQEGISINAKSSGNIWGIFFMIATTAFTAMIPMITARSKQRKPQKFYKKWEFGQPMLEVAHIEED